MDMHLLKLMISFEGGLFDNKPAFPFFYLFIEYFFFLKIVATCLVLTYGT